MSAYSLTAHALTGALTKMAVRPTIDDVDAWGKSIGLYPHFGSAIFAIHNIDCGYGLDEAKARLERAIIRYENMQERRPGRFIEHINAYVATKQMLDHIAAFERRQSGRSAA